ncbi:MAG: flagellar motor switch protein FliG [Vulcanimicrobiota bacterium]
MLKISNTITPDGLSPRQKAAILLISLPPEVSAQVFREFGPDEVQAISMEISKLPQISPEVRAQIIEEFMHTNTMDGLNPAAINPAAALVGGGNDTSAVTQHGGGAATNAFDSRPTAAISRTAAGSKPLEFLKKVDPKQLLAIIRKEHPQTMALVLNHLQPSQASAVLGELPPAVQTEVATRLAEMGKVTREILHEVERVLENRLYAVIEGEYTPNEGREILVDILSHADQTLEDGIMKGLTQKKPHLASDIKEKLCDFDDMNNLDDQSLQQVLRLTDIRDLVLALRGASKELQERIYNAFSPEMAKALQEESESLGQVPWEEVKAAQQQIRNILRGLVTLGKVKFKQE